jgi:alanine racemase
MGLSFVAAPFFSNAPAMMIRYQEKAGLIGGDIPAPRLCIKQNALRHNLTQFRRLAPRSKILLPVKANAYGCGLATLYPFFVGADVDMLGVANCNEAIELRQLGWEKPVMNLGGFFRGNVRSIIDHRVTASITDLWQVSALGEAAVDEPVSIHLKLDLGMGRIGIQEHELSLVLQALRANAHVRVDGIFTHFPHSGPEAEPHTREQNERFTRIAGEIITFLNLDRSKVLLHAANSYSAAFFPYTHHDMIRPGILFYGYYQSEQDRLAHNQRFDFKPALELLATPISMRTLPKGAGISYSSLYHVTEESERVAVLPLGYADGIPRALSNQISFGRYPLRGRVTMDQIVLGHAENATEVRLLGEGVPSLEYWGELSQSFSYEIMSHLGNRLQRVLVA